MLAQRVKARLEALDIGLLEAARRGEFGRDYVADIVSGRKKGVHAGNLAKLAKALDCAVEYLTGGQADPGEYREPALPAHGVPATPCLPLLGALEHLAYRPRASKPLPSVPVQFDPRHPKCRQYAFLIRAIRNGLPKVVEDYLTVANYADYTETCGACKTGDLVVLERSKPGDSNVELTCREVRYVAGKLQLILRFEHPGEVVEFDPETMRILGAVIRGFQLYA